jgi:hypothetical protein
VLTQPAFHCPPINQFKTDISQGSVSLSFSGLTGNIVINASQPWFIAGDVGKAIIVGPGRGYITSVGGSTNVDGSTGATRYLGVNVTVNDPFISMSVAAGQWWLYGAPQSYFGLGTIATANPKNWNSSNKLGLGGIQNGYTFVNFPVTANLPPPFEDSFRSTDYGRYIVANGAVMQIVAVINSHQVQVQLLSTVNETFTGANGSIRAMPISGGAWSIEDPAFSAVNGYPRACAFMGSRLWLGGSAKLATTVYGSVVGDYENFCKGTLDDDSVEFTEDSGQFDTIFWMAPYQGQLVTGNLAGEWAVGSGSGVGGNSTTITPSNINTLVQSLYGSSRIQPILVESQLLYVQHNMTRILEFSFSIYSSVFASREMNLYAGVMNASGFKEIKYQQNPDRLVWVTCNDGELLAMTYKKDDDVWGWSRQATPLPDSVVSIGIMPSADNITDDLWMVTNRNELGYFVEKADPNTFTDGCTKTDLGSSVSSVSGLAYLSGREVAIIGDGAYLGTVTVPSSGTITLPSPSQIVEVGLNYVSSMAGLNLEVKGGLNSQGYLKRFVKLWARLQGSVNILINGQRVAFRGTDPMTQALTPQTIDVSMTNLRTDRQGIWTVVQDLPLPCTVVSVFGDITIGEN